MGSLPSSQLAERHEILAERHETAVRSNTVAEKISSAVHSQEFDPTFTAMHHMPRIFLLVTQVALHCPGGDSEVVKL